MPNNKKKSISSIKNADSIHPYSRKAHQLKRAHQRMDKLQGSSLNKQSLRSDKMSLLVFLKSKLSLDDTSVSNATLDEWVMDYITRHEKEIKEIESKLRKDRPLPPRLSLLQSLLKKELIEYEEKGIDLPILSDSKNVLSLRRWNEDYNALDQIKLKVFKRGDLTGF